MGIQEGEAIGMEKGLKEGIEKGMEKGKLLANIELAKNLKTGGSYARHYILY